MAFKNGMRPVHPGEVLREEYLRPLDMSVNALAKRLGIPTSRLNDIVLERRGVTPDTAMRLAGCFGGDARKMAATFEFAPQNEIAQALASGESLIWSGAPRKGLALRPSDAYFIPFRLLWGGFAPALTGREG